MATSVDGRIVTDGWPDGPAIRREYEQIHTTYEADAWMCGRITMEPFAGAARSDADVKREYVGPPRDDYIASGDHESFAVAIDPSGRLAWKENNIDGDHVVAVLTEGVSDEYLAFLRDRGVSYLLAGKRDVDLISAQDKKLFWIEGTDLRFQGYNYFGQHPQLMLEWFDTHMLSKGPHAEEACAPFHITAAS
jgi:2,5-diamino-6-(ribosylamino)-4(3H)-pyrimidinone 5'-phosphate reductase